MKSVIIDLSEEFKFNHSTWESIHRFAESGAVVRNITLYNTCNRIEYSLVFWDLVKDLPNLKLKKEHVLEFFNQNGIVVFVAELDGNIVGMMVFDLYQNWISDLCTTLEADYWLAGYKEGIHINAPAALCYEACQFFRQIGCDYLNLGSGENCNISAEDLIDWKSGFIGKSTKTFELRK